MPRSSSSRKDSPAAQPAEVADLDDINIDDMFKGGLFEGLDIDEDMEGMADITDNSKTSPPSTKKTKSTKQQRKSGSGNNSSANLDAVELNLFEDIGVPDGVSGPSTVKPPASSSSATTASITTKSGRRTKRKIHIADDDDDEYEPVSKKTKRKPKPTAKARATKKKGSKAASVEGPVAAPAPAPARKLGKGRKVLPLNRGTADSSSVSGTRANKRKLPNAASVTAPKASTTAPTTSAPSLTKTVDTTKAAVVTSAAPPPPPASVAKGGRQRSAANAELAYEKLMDTSSCGLKPSRTMFYPFLPSLPPELHIKKYAKSLSVLDRIHQAFAGDTSKKSVASSQTAGSNEKKNKEPPAKDADPIFQLLVSELDHSNAAPSSSATLLLQRRQAMGPSIASGRRMIGHSDQMALVQDLRAVCALLTRQFDFLSQSLENMEHWCKDSFTPADYTQVFDPNAPAALTKEAMASGGSGNKRRKSGLGKGSILGSLSGPNVQIKIVSGDFKLHKPFSPVTAYIATGSQPAPKKARSSKASAASDSGRMVSSKSGVLASSLHAAAQPPPVKTYAQLRPGERRLRIVEAIRQKALALDRGEEDSEKVLKLLEKRHAAAAKVIEEELEQAANASAQNNLLMGMANTTTFWKWVEKAGFYGNLTQAEISEMLSATQEPEPIQQLWYLEEEHRQTREMASSLPGEKSKRIDDKSIDGAKKGRKPQDSSSSTFVERITDLLVDEGTGDEDDDDSDDESIFDGWSQNGTESSTPTDLGMFNHEERVFIHLRSIGLVDENCPPPVVVEEDDEVKVQQVNSDKPIATDEHEEFDDVLRAMQDDLIRLQKRNNSRAAYLEKVSQTQMIFDKQKKRKDDQDNFLINKHNQLLKKQKETKKGKQKQVKKGEQNWMPW